MLFHLQQRQGGLGCKIWVYHGTTAKPEHMYLEGIAMPESLTVAEATNVHAAQQSMPL